MKRKDDQGKVVAKKLAGIADVTRVVNMVESAVNL
jgi:hypothetical protein